MPRTLGCPRVPVRTGRYDLLHHNARGERLPPSRASVPSLKDRSAKLLPNIGRPLFESAQPPHLGARPVLANTPSATAHDVGRLIQFSPVRRDEATLDDTEIAFATITPAHI